MRKQNIYSHSKAEAIINESNIDDVFRSIYTTIISNIHKFIGITKCITKGNFLIAPLHIFLV